MKKKLLYIVSLPLLLISGCNKNIETQVNFDEITNLHTDISPLKYMESNEYLDLKCPVDEIHKSSTKLSPEDIAKLKAIAYRFYKNTTIKDSAYVLNTTAKEIQISDSYFNALKKNIEEVNLFIKQNNANGITTHMFEFTDEMLKSRL